MRFRSRVGKAGISDLRKVGGELQDFLSLFGTEGLLLIFLLSLIFFLPERSARNLLLKSASSWSATRRLSGSTCK